MLKHISGEQRRDEYGLNIMFWAQYTFLTILVLCFAFLSWYWLFCRITVEKGELVLLLRKSGRNLSNNMLLAPDQSYKGPQFAILREGRYFRNPYTWWWSKPQRATVIPEGHVGIKIRKYGAPLRPGQVVVHDQWHLFDDTLPLNPKSPKPQIMSQLRQLFQRHQITLGPKAQLQLSAQAKPWIIKDRQTYFIHRNAAGQVQVYQQDIIRKGIIPEPLRPGRYYLNTWAYDVEIYKMVKIKPGYRGIVTLLVGQKPRNPNVFVVEQGERGTQPFILPPGTYPEYSNPYVHRVTAIDIRSQKFEMAREYAITFPSKYGFDIKVEGTIEWAPDIHKLPEVFVKYVDEKDLHASGGINNIQKKIILPFARSFFRLIGGEYEAVDYITGDKRLKVQEAVEADLKKACSKEGILIKSFVIRSTEPPRKIREQYERREIARRQTDQYHKEIETEIGTVVMENGQPKRDADGKVVRRGGRLEKVIQERRKDREERLGKIRMMIAAEIRAAEQYQKVEETKASRKLEVARVLEQAARDTAAKILAEGCAQAAVTVMKYKAEAEAVKAKVQAFGNGEKYAQWQLIKKMAPGITKILSNTEGLFARLFERFAAMSQKASSSNQKASSSADQEK